jgi:hypothetical protein
MAGPELDPEFCFPNGFNPCKACHPRFPTSRSSCPRYEILQAGNFGFELLQTKSFQFVTT